MNIVFGIIAAIILFYLIKKAVVYYQQYKNTTCTSDASPEITATASHEKAAFFKFSYVICIIYGCILLAIMALSALSVTANKLFLIDYKPLTLTFSGGIVFVLIILIWQLITYEDKKIVVSPYDSDLCPEFWKLAPTPASNVIYTNAVTKQPGKAPLFAYQCVPDTTILQTNRSIVDPKTNAPVLDNSNGFSAAQINPYGQRIVNPGQPNQYIAVDTSASSQATMGDNLDKTVLTNIVGQMSQLTTSAGTNKLVCDQLYPQYLNSLNNNDTTYSGQPNTYACTYAQACGIPWASLCGQ